MLKASMIAKRRAQIYRFVFLNPYLSGSHLTPFFMFLCRFLYSFFPFLICWMFSSCMLNMYLGCAPCTFNEFSFQKNNISWLQQPIAKTRYKVTISHEKEKEVDKKRKLKFDQYAKGIGLEYLFKSLCLVCWCSLSNQSRRWRSYKNLSIFLQLSFPEKICPRLLWQVISTDITYFTIIYHQKSLTIPSNKSKASVEIFPGNTWAQPALLLILLQLQATQPMASQGQLFCSTKQARAIKLNIF